MYNSINLFRYYTVTSDGTSTLTFNATSIQNGVILGFLVLVLGALILPFLGVNLFSFEDEVSLFIHLYYFATQYYFSLHLLAPQIALLMVSHIIILPRELAWT